MAALASTEYPHRSRQPLSLLWTGLGRKRHISADTLRWVSSVAPVTGILGLYHIAFQLFGLPYWRPLYTLLWLAIFAIAGMRLIHRGIRSGQLRVLLAMVVVIMAWVVPSVMQQELHFVYFIGDIGLLGFYPVMYMGLIAFPGLLRDERCMHQLMLLLLISAAAGIFADTMGLVPGHELPGFPAPSTLLFPLLLVAVLRSQGSRRGLLVAVLLLIFVMTILAGKRLPIFAALFVISLLLASKGPGRVALLCLAVLLTPFVMLAQHHLRDVVGVVAQGRFSQFANEETDDSVEGRWMEVADVIDIIEHKATIGEILFGHGHGAVYAPTNSSILSVETRLKRVHHIHVGLFLILFRYGLLGVALYLWFVALVIWGTIKALCVNAIRCYRSTYVVYLLGAWAVIIQSLVDQPFHDPLNTLIVLGYLTLLHRPKLRILTSPTRRRLRTQSPRVLADLCYDYYYYYDNHSHYSDPERERRTVSAFGRDGWYSIWGWLSGGRRRTSIKRRGRRRAPKASSVLTAHGEHQGLEKDRPGDLSHGRADLEADDSRTGRCFGPNPARCADARSWHPASTRGSPAPRPEWRQAGCVRYPRGPQTLMQAIARVLGASWQRCRVALEVLPAVDYFALEVQPAVDDVDPAILPERHLRKGAVDVHSDPAPPHGSRPHLR